MFFSLSQISLLTWGIAVFAVALAVLQAVAWRQKLGFMLGFVAFGPVLVSLLFGSIGRSIRVGAHHGVPASAEQIERANRNFVTHVARGMLATGISVAGAIGAVGYAHLKRKRESDAGGGGVSATQSTG